MLPPANSALRLAVSGILRGGNDSEGAATRGAPGALDKLRDRLGRIIGATGFDALCWRSVALAQEWHPVDSLDGPGLLSERTQPTGTQATDEFVVTVVSNIAVLLATFIGSSLSRKILKEVWPSLEIAEHDLVVEGGETSE
jgi:hypothetical protein